jgi:hypothetical protein
LTCATSTDVSVAEDGVTVSDLRLVVKYKSLLLLSIGSEKDAFLPFWYSHTKKQENKR